MTTKLNKLIRANLDDLVLCCGMVGGVFLLIQIIMALAVHFTDEGSALLLSGAVLPIVSGIMALISTMGHTMVLFPQAVQFSQTRRRALRLTLGLDGFLTLCSMGLAALLNLLERTFGPELWLRLSGRAFYSMDGIPPIPERGLSYDMATLRAKELFIEDFALDWWWFPLIALGGVALGLILGALMQRFGGKSMWLLWGVWMFFILAPQLLPWETYTITNWLIPALIVLTLAGLLWSLWSLLHATVKL